MHKNIAVSIHGLGKKYFLGKRESYLTLRDRLMELPSKLFTRQKPPEFWALKDLSLDISSGEVLGLIGRNGAGKSTLLKILARIVEPTTGEAIMRGRVASMLEVGTGFNPELTGRENVYLNGAIIGMKKAEITAKFSEIIEFSGIEKFIDTPVKHYSSGMYVRLAFAVAAHLDSDILLVDEVLAVGDSEFQKKCMQKMSELSKYGKTIVLVSHNMNSIQNMCTKVAYLEQGNLKYLGSPKTAINAYLSNLAGKDKKYLEKLKNRRGTGEIKFTGFYYQDSTGHKRQTVRSGETVSLVFEYKRTLEIKSSVIVSFSITDMTGYSLILHRTNFMSQDFASLPKQGKICCTIKDLPLVEGLYSIGAQMDLGQNQILDAPGQLGLLTVESGDFFHTGNPGLANHSPILVRGEWSLL